MGDALSSRGHARRVRIVSARTRVPRVVGVSRVEDTKNGDRGCTAGRSPVLAGERAKWGWSRTERERLMNETTLLSAAVPQGLPHGPAAKAQQRCTIKGRKARPVSCAELPRRSSWPDTDIRLPHSARDARYPIDGVLKFGRRQGKHTAIVPRYLKSDCEAITLRNLAAFALSPARYGWCFEISQLRCGRAPLES